MYHTVCCACEYNRKAIEYMIIMLLRSILETENHDKDLMLSHTVVLVCVCMCVCVCEREREERNLRMIRSAVSICLVQSQSLQWAESFPLRGFGFLC